MSTRSYLSIGDVLTLLRQEFPDVTISKIRFLESQGLVNPERTPSGYRKFYEHDVERLRWVLRQQREHFLPLKVIKDRLDDDGAGSAGPSPKSTVETGSPVPVNSTDDHMTRGDAGRHAPEPVLVGHRATSEVTVGGVGRRPEGGSGPTLPGIESALRMAPTSAGAKPSVTPRASSPNAPTATAAKGAAAHRTPGSDRSAEGPAGGVVGDTAAASSPRPEARPPVGASSARPPARRPRPTAGDQSEPTPSAVDPDIPTAGGAGTRASGGASPPPEVPMPATGELDGASLSVEELSAACDLDVAVLLDLQEYGLLTPTSVAGLEYFDEEDLAVATLAAGFARFGIEPRHLRLYKNAADREAGFVEQILLPMVRQRNPEARARAHATADELAGLGQQLRSALLRRALGGLLDG